MISKILHLLQVKNSHTILLYTVIIINVSYIVARCEIYHPLYCTKCKLT
jgi:hypothetical protein